MSAAEDYARLRADRQRGFHSIPQERKPRQYMVKCVECGKVIPWDGYKVCCPECWEKINGRG